MCDCIYMRILISKSNRNSLAPFRLARLWLPLYSLVDILVTDRELFLYSQPKKKTLELALESRSASSHKNMLENSINLNISLKSH